MGNNQSINKHVNFEDVQSMLPSGSSNSKCLLINTLNIMEQKCLIQGTISASQEEDIVNSFLQNHQTTMGIIVYGKNANDMSAYTKHQQLIKMGFSRCYLYPGGIFEWLLLQDIYGDDSFPTTCKELDILKYKPSRILHTNLIEYSNMY